MKWQDLTWWEHTPESFYGQDKDGNVYCIDNETGEVVPAPNASIDIMWFGANESEVEQFINKCKEYAEKEYGHKPNETVVE